MTTIAILPTSNTSTRKQRFEAVSGHQHAEGATVGKALDALSQKIGKAKQPNLIVVQSTEGDKFFTAKQTAKMKQLMAEWRRCRDDGVAFDQESEKSLQDLVNLELAATAKRCEAMGLVGK